MREGSHIQASRVWCIHILILVVSLIAAMSPVAAQGYEPPSLPSDRDGLNFGAGVSVSLEEVPAGAESGYLTSMSIGCGFLSHVDIGLRLYYGEFPMTRQEGLPLTGIRLLGGGGVEGRYFFSRTSAWSPYVSAGYDLLSVSDGNTASYAGYAIHGSLGLEYAVSSIFAAGLDAGYRHVRFTQMKYSGKTLLPAFVPFSDNRPALALLIRVYP